MVLNNSSAGKIFLLQPFKSNIRVVGAAVRDFVESSGITPSLELTGERTIKT